MKKLSLKFRLIICFLCMAGMTWIVSAVLAWYESRELSDEFFDTYQLALARQLSTADWDNITPNTQKIANKVIDNLKDDGEEEDEALGFAVFDKNGKMVFHDNKKGKFFKYNSSASGFAEQSLGKKQRKWRIVWVKSVDGKYRIAIGQEIDYRNEVALEMIEETFLPWGIGLVFLLFMCIWFIYREFKPLQKIASDFTNRASDDLSSVEYHNAPKEVEPLLDAVNDLLSRVGKMLERERSFISDAAHELRSPLTALNVQLDVVELASDDEETQKKALKNLRKGIARSSHLVEQMLDLSRIETQIKGKDKEKLCFKDIILDAISEQEFEAEQKEIKITTMFNGNFGVEVGQKFLWSLLVRNLLNNAINYSKNGAEVIVTVEENKIVFENNKISFDKENVSKLGTRFFRPAGQKMNGSGLGLSIVEKIATLHGCKVMYDVKNDVFSVIICYEKQAH